MNALHSTPLSTRTELKEVPLIGTDPQTRNPGAGKRGAFSTDNFVPGKR